MKSIKSTYNDVQEILWTKKFKAGYILQKEVVGDGLEHNAVVMTVAYNHNGNYIGDSKMAYFLCNKRGIVPELITSKNRTCSIGFNEKEQKWYGYSHRAICGFEIGHITKEDDCSTTSGWIESYLEEHPEEDKRVSVGFEVKTLEDAKRVAIAFAESVS